MTLRGCTLWIDAADEQQCDAWQCADSRSGAAEGIERPTIGTLLVTQDIDVAIIRTDLEAAKAQAIPPVQDFLHLVRACALLLQEGEAQGTLIRPITCVAFDLEFHLHEPRRKPVLVQVWELVYFQRGGSAHWL